MRKTAAIVAACAFLCMQFVHAAVLDTPDQHSAPGIADLGEHHHGDADGPDGGDGDNGCLASLHSSAHDHHHVTSPAAGEAVAVALPHEDRIAFSPNSHLGRSLTPPVPPPLA